MCLVQRRKLFVLPQLLNLLELALAKQADHRDGVAVFKLVLGRRSSSGDGLLERREREAKQQVRTTSEAS